MAVTMRFKDIQLDKLDNWNTIKQAWQAGNYANMIAELSKSELSLNWIKASEVNDMTDKIVELENLEDPDFKKNRPITSQSEPENPEANILWFEVM